MDPDESRLRCRDVAARVHVELCIEVAGGEIGDVGRDAIRVRDAGRELLRDGDGYGNREKDDRQ